MTIALHRQGDTMTEPAFRRGASAAASAERSAASKHEDDVEIGRLVRTRSANRYPGTCRTCGGEVRAGEGVCYREQDSRGWVIVHADGQCPMPVTTTTLPRIEARTGQVYTGRLWPGFYTMVDANGQHVTYHVRVQRTDDDFAPGETIIEYLSGPDNTSDYTAFGFIREGSLVVWKRFRESPNPDVQHKINGALALLRDPSRAEVAKACIRCGALLTVPESIAAGIGPTCASKGW